MATQLNVRALTNQEAAISGYTHEAVIEPIKDLTETTTNTAMVFNLFKTQAGDVLEKCSLHFDPALKDASDAAFNDNTVSVGDEDSATRFMSAVQGNENGTEVLNTFENTAYAYSAVKQITATVNSMSAKSLSNLDTGKIIILFKLNRTGDLATAA